MTWQKNLESANRRSCITLAQRPSSSKQRLTQRSASSAKLWLMQAGAAPAGPPSSQSYMRSFALRFANQNGSESCGKWCVSAVTGRPVLPKQWRPSSSGLVSSW